MEFILFQAIFIEYQEVNLVVYELQKPAHYLGLPTSRAASI